MSTCLVFHISCGTIVKGVLGVAMGVTLFIGSVYLLLSAVFGRWMAYLITVLALTGWLMIMSSMWFLGYFAQGPTTPRNQGPRGSEAAWLPISASLETSTARFPTFASYPGGPWKLLGNDTDTAASRTSVASTVQAYLATQANAEIGKDPLAPDAITSTQFTVNNVRFAADNGTPLAVAQGYFTGGGPLITVTLYHDKGSVPRYSLMFLAGSVLLFGAHLPLLDRAEKKRKEFLTGGNAPPWYGPA
jgi:hypothetical protein